MSNLEKRRGRKRVSITTRTWLHGQHKMLSSSSLLSSLHKFVKVLDNSGGGSSDDDTFRYDWLCFKLIRLLILRPNFYSCIRATVALCLLHIHLVILTNYARQAVKDEVVDVYVRTCSSLPPRTYSCCLLSFSFSLCLGWGMRSWAVLRIRWMKLAPRSSFYSVLTANNWQKQDHFSLECRKDWLSEWASEHACPAMMKNTKA